MWAAGRAWTLLQPPRPRRPEQGSGRRPPRCWRACCWVTGLLGRPRAAPARLDCGLRGSRLQARGSRGRRHGTPSVHPWRPPRRGKRWCLRGNRKPVVTPGDPVCFQSVSKHWGSETRWPWGRPYVARVQGEWIDRSLALARRVQTAGARLVPVAWPDTRRLPSPASLCGTERPAVASLVPAIPTAPVPPALPSPSLPLDCSISVGALTDWECFQFYFLH